MIKFKKILEKAASSSGQSAAAFAAPDAYAEEPGRAEAGTSAVAVEEAPGADLVTEDFAEDRKAREALVNEEMVESVMDDLFSGRPEGVEIEAVAIEEERPGEAETPGEERLSEGISPEDVSAAFAAEAGGEAAAAEAHAPDGDFEQVINSLVADALSVLNEPAAEETEHQAAATAEAAAKAEAGTAAEGASPSEAAAQAEGGETRAAQAPAASAESAEALGDSFVAEVDRLLAEFGQIGSEDAEAQGQAETAEAGLSESLPDELDAAVRQSLAGGAAEPDEAEAAVEEISRETEAPKEDERPPAEKTGKEARTQGHAAARAAQDAKTAADKKKKLGGQTDLSAGYEVLSQTLSKEEKDALFAEETQEQFGTNEAGNRVVREIDEALGGAESVFDVEGKPSEVDLDFSAASVGLEAHGEDEQKPEHVDAADLLSQVLGDLDKLGAVEKPNKEEPAEEKPAEVVEDFSQLLQELESENAQAQAESRPKEKRDAGKQVAKAASRADASEAKLVSEALSEADGDSDVDEGASFVLETGGEAEPAALDEPEPVEEAAAEGEGKAGATEAKAGLKKGDEEDAEPKQAPAEEAEAAEEGGQAQAGGEAQQGEGEVSDKDALLANLEASMEMAARTQKEAKEEPKGKGADEAAASDEDAIRNEVLARSKEVEQKVLDEVFGEDVKGFRSEVKTEMAKVDQDQRAAGAKGTVKGEDAGKVAAAAKGTGIQAAASGEASARAGDMGFGLMWVAYQMNRPFRRWINTPGRMILVAILSLGLMSTALLWLAVALVMTWFGR